MGRTAFRGAFIPLTKFSISPHRLRSTNTYSSTLFRSGRTKVRRRKIGTGRRRLKSLGRRRMSPQSGCFSLRGGRDALVAPASAFTSAVKGPISGRLSTPSSPASCLRALFHRHGLLRHIHHYHHRRLPFSLIIIHLLTGRFLPREWRTNHLA